jgi:hypothetical protein
MSLNAEHDCFLGFAINGVSKKIAQCTGLWTIMRGSAAENDMPSVILDFEFSWPDSLKSHWAAVTIQAAWRAYKARVAAAAAGLKTAR